MFPPKLIVCPTDFSDGSLRAVQEAEAQALHFGAELCMVHVTLALSEVSELGAILDAPEHNRALREDAKLRLQILTEPLTAKGIRTRIVVGTGDPASEIVRIAEEQHADLVVIATHGNTGWRHLAFGSVAEKVLRLASCPVLSVRMAQRAASAHP